MWADLFGFDHMNGPAGQIVKRKFMGQMYEEISELKTFVNFKGARCLGFCLHVMGLKLSQRDIDRESLPLHRAVLRWTKTNYALLYRRNSEIAEYALAPEMSFDVERMRIVQRHQHPLRQEPTYFYFPVDPPPPGAPPAETV